MFVILPILALLFLIPIFRQKGQGWHRSILLAGLAWGTFVVLTTEVLSLFGLLTFVPLVICWALAVLGLGFVAFKLQKTARLELPVGDFFQLSPFLKFAVGSVIAIALLIGLIAALAPPNNWDSMTYHMGRVVHWMQNGGVAHYPTAITRQLSLGPWSGFAVTHLQILSRGDRFANFVQWGCMVGCIVGVSAIAGELGGDRRGQVFAAVTCATIPMGILQASSTQTDYVGAFWMLCFVYFGLVSIRDEKRVSQFVPIGASLGLAILAKGTAYFYLFPFGLWFVAASLKQCGWKAWRPFLIAGAIALAINFGHFQRNFEVFGSALGTSGDYKLEVFSIPILISNTVRNIALHLSTPVRSVNLILIAAVTAFHGLLGVDVNDPRTTFPPGQKFDVHSLINHEDLAGNPLHILLFFALSLLFLFRFNHFEKRRRYYLAGYLIAIAVGFVLFCALIAWSPWRSRLHLPLFVLSSAFIGVVLAELVKPKLANAVATLLIVASLIWVIFNESRPLILNSKIVEENRVENLWNTSRTDLYFINIPELQKPYVGAVDFIADRSCTDVGLRIGGDTWEYQFWVLLQQQSDRPVRIEHVRVENESALKADSPEYREFSPCAIIVSNTPEAGDRSLVLGDKVYQKRWSEDPVSVFVPDN